MPTTTTRPQKGKGIDEQPIFVPKTEPEFVIFIWVFGNVINHPAIFDGWIPTHENGDEWGMVYMKLLYQH